MEARVKPFAQMLKNELGVDYTIVTFKTDPTWNADRIFEENVKFIKFHKSMGYTFYDIGLDDTFPILGIDEKDYGVYYLMELMEVFGSK